MIADRAVAIMARLRFRIAILIVVAIFFGLQAAAVFAASDSAEPATPPACAADLAVFLGGPAPLSYQIEIADTVPERARGLMYRRDLAPDHGMLFIYESPRPVAFWMKNTLIPLDLVFMDARGVVRHIHQGAVPLDLTSIPGARPDDPDPDRLMVLEIAAGGVARDGLMLGMTLRHPGLDSAIAATPCD